MVACGSYFPLSTKVPASTCVNFFTLVTCSLLSTARSLRALVNCWFQVGGFKFRGVSRFPLWFPRAQIDLKPHLKPSGLFHGVSSRASCQLSQTFRRHRTFLRARANLQTAKRSPKWRKLETHVRGWVWADEASLLHV